MFRRKAGESLHARLARHGKFQLPRETAPNRVPWEERGGRGNVYHKQAIKARNAVADVDARRYASPDKVAAPPGRSRVRADPKFSNDGMI